MSTSSHPPGLLCPEILRVIISNQSMILLNFLLGINSVSVHLQNLERNNPKISVFVRMKREYVIEREEKRGEREREHKYDQRIA